MKKLNITKERFEKSRYFQRKYGKLEYVSESGKLFKTSKGKIIKFNETAKVPMKPLDERTLNNGVDELENRLNELQ